MNNKLEKVAYFTSGCVSLVVLSLFIVGVSGISIGPNFLNNSESIRINTTLELDDIINMTTNNRAIWMANSSGHHQPILYVDANGQLSVGHGSGILNLDVKADMDMLNNKIINIGGSGTDFNASGALTLADSLLITPRATAPSTCTEGTIYSDTSGALCYCNTTNVWHDLVGQGGSACT